MIVAPTQAATINTDRDRLACEGVLSCPLSTAFRIHPFITLLWIPAPVGMSACETYRYVSSAVVVCYPHASRLKVSCFVFHFIALSVRSEVGSVETAARRHKDAGFLNCLNHRTA